MKRVTKSIKINPELWREIKIHVAKIDTDISSFVESAIKKALKSK
ncbi:hypothetical protein LCGC14_1455590 [marine sediment metagenome]|uniref:Uncharacterized protein n=1 Tax=marine sediment metagenome TaxID=412755 RepID=A0A0F9K2T2_9ZZZZ